MKTLTLNLLIFFSIILISINSFSQIPSQTDFYRKAAQAYRDAASKTNCADRRKVLLEYAQFQDKYADYLTNSARGISSTEPREPSSRIPDCAADKAGAQEGGGGTKSQTSSGSSPNYSSGSGSSSSSSGYRTNTIDSQVMENAYNNSKNSGKKESGALFDAFIAGAQAAPDAETKKVLAGAGVVLGGVSALAERANEKSKKKKMATYEKQKQVENSTNEEAAEQNVNSNETPVRPYSDANSLFPNSPAPRPTLSRIEIDNRLHYLKSEISSEIAGMVLSRTLWGLVGITGVSIFAVSISDTSTPDAAYTAITGGAAGLALGAYGIGRIFAKNKKLRALRQEQLDLLQTKQGLTYNIKPYYGKIFGQNSIGVRINLNF